MCFIEHIIKVAFFKKNIMKNLFTSLILLLFVTAGFAQQETHFTQFMYNKLQINPAYAGARGHGSFTGIFRQQWAGFDGAPRTALLSFDTPLLGDRIGLGFTFSNYTIGVENTYNVTGAYAYNIKISKEASFRFGIQGNLRHQAIDFSDPSVVIRQNNDNSINENETVNQTTGNFGIGLYLTYKQLYFGASVPFFFPNEIGINTITATTAEQTSHFYLMAGTLVPISKKVDIKPSFLLKYVNNAPIDLDFNLSFVYDRRVTAGVSVRHGGDDILESIDFLAMYQVNSLGIGVAYDFGLTELNSSNSGSYEVLLRYDLIKERADIANPRFFF